MMLAVGFVTALVCLFIGVTLLNRRIPAPVDVGRIDMHHCEGCANVACAFKPEKREED